MSTAATTGKVLLKSATKMSLNDRFKMIRQKTAATGAMVGNRALVQQNIQQGSSRNKRLALQMANRSSVLAALKLKRKSIKQRLDTSNRPNLRFKRRQNLNRNQNEFQQPSPQKNGGRRFKLNRNNFDGTQRIGVRRGGRRGAPRIGARGGGGSQIGNRLTGRSRGTGKPAFARNRLGNNNSQNNGQVGRKFGNNNVNKRQFGANRNNNQRPQKKFNRFATGTASVRGNVRGTNKRGRGRGRGNARGNAQRKPMTKWNKNQKPKREDLDKDLDAYMAKTKSSLDADLDAYMAEATG